MKRAFAATILIALLTATTPAWAQSFEAQPNSFFIKTGIQNKVSENLLLKNLSGEKKSLSLSWQGYLLSQEETVDPKQVAAHSIDFAFVNEAKIDLEPFGTAATTIDFTTPEKIQPADYYGSLILDDGSEKQSVDFTVRVLGKEENKLTIKNVTEGSSGTEILVANEGNLTTNFQSLVAINKFLGGTLSIEASNLSLKANQQKIFSLPHQKLSPGFYSEDSSVKLDSQQRFFAKSVSFWVSPWLFILAGLVSALAVFGLIFKFKWSKK